MSTYGIIFAGTPHQGGEGVAWGVRLVKIASIFANTNANMLRHLQRDSEEVQRLLRDYASISNEFVTKFAYETLQTRLPIGNYIEVSYPFTNIRHLNDSIGCA
jgi:3-methyladenine DNA glycosylase AlkC